MQKNVKNSLLLLMFIFVLVMSISFTFAQDLDNSANDLAINDNDDSISIENQDDGYDELSVVDNVNENSHVNESLAVGSNDEKLGYADSTSGLYFKFDQEDFTITEGEGVTITGSIVDSAGNNPNGPDFLVSVYKDQTFLKWINNMNNHKISLSIDASNFMARDTPYKILFQPEESPEYCGEFLEGNGNPELASSWVLITVNSNTPEPTSLTEAYVDYENGLDTNTGTDASSAFKTIEHALSVVGDDAVIYVAGGVHYLDGVDANGLDVLKNVSIIGMTDNVVIDARNTGRIFKIQGNTVLLSNLIFKNGNAFDASDKRGAALWVNGTTLTIDNCKFINNTAGATGSTYGAAVNLKATTTTIKGSYFEGNSAVYSGAVNAEKGNILLNVSNSVFTNNEVINTGNYAVGAGICAYGETIVDRSTFYGNKVTKDNNGRSIKQYDGHLTVTNSIILDGLGAINIKEPANATLTNNWWGQNDTTKDTTPTELNLTNVNVESYLYLTLSTSTPNLVVNKAATIDIRLISQDFVDIVDVPAIVSSNDGTFNQDTFTLVNGNGNVQFTSNKVGVNSITVNVLGVSDTIDLVFDEAYEKGQIVDKMVLIDHGVVSGNVEYVAVNPGTTTGSLNFVIPQGVTNIKSVIVVINDYSGSGAQTYGLYSNVTLNTPNGLEVLAFDELRMDEFPSFTLDPNVYGFNKYTTRQYSDYQMIFDITGKVNNLSPGDTITIDVTNTKISDLSFDGRIKLISLLFAYDDGDGDNFTYWFNAGQLWSDGSESFNIDTSDYTGKTNNISIRSVALSSELAKIFKINNINANPTTVNSGNYYYKYLIWDNIAPKFNQGQDTSFFFTCSDQGLYTPSYKTNAILLVATELANEPALTEVYVDYDNGSDDYLGTTVSAPFKTIGHALSVVGDGAVIHVAGGVHYLDGVDANGLDVLKNVSIIGMADNVIIDARNTGRIFKIQGNTVLLSNLIFKNGNAFDASDKRGAALWVNGTTLTIDNCKFINNTAGATGSTYGAAVNLKATTTTIKDSYFEGNSAVYSGAVNAEKGNVLLNVSNSVFTNNEVINTGNYAVGAGICAYGETIVDRSTFYGNKVTKDNNGRSIKQYDGHLTVTNSIILDGLGAINIKEPANATLTNNWWGQNDTTKDSTPTELNLTNAEVTSYICLSLKMYANGTGVGDVASVNINLVSSDGSNVDIVDLPVTIVAVNGNLNKNAVTLVKGTNDEVEYTITEVGDNSVTVDVLGVKDSYTLNYEDVISTEVVYVDYVNGLNTNSGVTKDSPVKTIEKAIKIVKENGIIYVANGVAYLDDSTPDAGISINKNIAIIGESLDAVISGNNAKRIFSINPGFTLTITNLTLTNGFSTAQGGAIFIDNGGSINISNSVISNSHANGAGGAIGATQGYIDNINNVAFINNSAGNKGGAVGISGGTATNSKLTIGDNCKFINNTASNYGSAVGAQSPNVVIGKNNLFEGNIATGTNGKGAVASNKITLGTGNVFVNNRATAGGALFAVLNSGTASGSYCFFINNTDNNGYTLAHYAGTSNNANNKFTLNDCYWGNNTPDFNAIFNKVFAHNTYLVLDVSADKENITYGDSAIITVDLTKNQNGQQIDVSSLPNIPLGLTVVNGNVSSDKIEFVEGIATTTYTPDELGGGSVVVNMYSVSETLTFTTVLPDVVISSVSTPWSQGIYPGVNNTFTVKITNNGAGAVENLVVEVYSNETGVLLMNYTIDSLASGASSIALTDPTIRPITEQTVWPTAQNNKIKFTFNLKYLDQIISTQSVDKILAYDGYLNKTYAYGGHDNIINRNYAITGDIIIASHDSSYYQDQFTRFRNETWNIETPEGAEIVKVFLYFNYNWDTTSFPNGWELTFNGEDILNDYLVFEKDRGNLGGYGAYDYGLLVFDVTKDYKVNDNNSFVISKEGNCALYPSTLFVLYNMSGSDYIKDVYFSDICDVFYPYYNSVGYDELLTAIVNFNNIDITNIENATLYAFGGSGGPNDADLSFNNIHASNVFKDDTDKDCRAYEFDVTRAISKDNVVKFITSPRSSTVVAYEQVLVVTKRLTPTVISTDVVDGSEFVAGKDLTVAVNVDLAVNGTYSLWIDGVLASDYGVLTVVNGEGSFIILAEDLTVGDHNITVQFNAVGMYKESENATYKFTVVKATEYNMTVEPVSSYYGDAINIPVSLPTNANGGNVSVNIEGIDYNATVVNGTAIIVGPDNLAIGNYSFTVVFFGDAIYDGTTKNVDVSILEPKIEIPVNQALDINVPTDSKSPTFSINLPSEATGNFTVSVDGNVVETKQLADGKASITVSDLSSGKHDVVISYSGDDKYAPITQNTTVSIPALVVKLSNNKNINMLYTAGTKYVVRVTLDGKAVVGKAVTFNINGKKVTVNTDKNGDASVKINLPPKTKKYTVTATYGGKTVKNTVKVNSIIKAKNLKIKKSKKVVKIKVSLKKVNKKYLKGKVLKLKIKGKTLKAKTNKKGVATFKVKKNVLKKLKVGNKYKYTVTYGKDKVTKKVTVKK